VLVIYRILQLIVYAAGTDVAKADSILMGITHPTMLARYNLRGQEASESSDAFFF
jgi:hypothetical protein